MKLVVVAHSKTKRLIPFTYNDYGEIILATVDESISIDDCIVTTINVEDNKLIPEYSVFLEGTLYGKFFKES